MERQQCAAGNGTLKLQLRRQFFVPMEAVVRVNDGTGFFCKLVMWVQIGPTKLGPANWDNQMPKKYRNKYRGESTRLKNWDYGSNAAYFVTICTHDRICFLAM